MERENYNLVNDGSDSDGPEATGVRIGEESTEQRGQASSATEVGEGICSFC